MVGQIALLLIYFPYAPPGLQISHLFIVTKTALCKKNKIILPVATKTFLVPDTTICVQTKQNVVLCLFLLFINVCVNKITFNIDKYY